MILEFSLHNHRLITRSYYLSISNKPRASPLQAPRSDSSGLLGQSLCVCHPTHTTIALLIVA